MYVLTVHHEMPSGDCLQGECYALNIKRDEGVSPLSESSDEGLLWCTLWIGLLRTDRDIHGKNARNAVLRKGIT
jgi:hypothetical protein